LDCGTHGGGDGLWRELVASLADLYDLGGLRKGKREQGEHNWKHLWGHGGIEMEKVNLVMVKL
jgi:hypothetical protein